MQKLPIKSTDRNIRNDAKVTGKDEPDINNSNNKTKTILRVILVILSIIAGTAICTTVIYFAFLKKDDDNNGISNRSEFNINSNLINGKLNKEKKVVEQQCIKGTGDLCKTCNEQNNECETCNSGFYLPSDEDDKSKCKRCSDINDRCEECYGTLNTIKCYSCKNGYIPFYNNNNEIIECNPKCQTGENELCKTCDFENNRCIRCNEGYYLPSDDLFKLKCKKCKDIVKNCNECHGEIYSVTCDNFVGEEKSQSSINLSYDEKREYCKEICENKPPLTCDGIGYELVDGECKLMYSFRATYYNEKPYEMVTFIYRFTSYIKKVKVDGVILDKPVSRYNFTESKVHVVYVLMDIPQRLVDYNSLFYGCKHMLSIHFTPLFNTSSAEVMTSMFCLCTNLTYINLQVFDTRNVERMFRMFGNCEKLTSIDITNFNTLKVKDMSDMFVGCHSLTSIDLSNMKAPQLVDISAMFAHCYSLTSIDFTSVQSKKLQYIQQMFHNCIKLKYVNISNLNTTRVVYMYDMFKNCSSLTSIDLSSFNTITMKYMDNMFNYCTSLTSIDISNFNTDNCYGIGSLFRGCTNLTYINIANMKYKYSSDIYQLLPNRGTIIVHPERVKLAEKYLSSKGWTIIPVTENN